MIMFLANSATDFTLSIIEKRVLQTIPEILSMFCGNLLQLGISFLLASRCL